MNPFPMASRVQPNIVRPILSHYYGNILIIAKILKKLINMFLFLVDKKLYYVLLLQIKRTVLNEESSQNDLDWPLYFRINTYSVVIKIFVRTQNSDSWSCSNWNSIGFGLRIWVWVLWILYPFRIQTNVNIWIVDV